MLNTSWINTVNHRPFFTSARATDRSLKNANLRINLIFVGAFHPKSRMTVLIVNK